MVSSALVSPPRVEPERLGVLVIDAQPAFFAGMAGNPESVLTRLEHLFALAAHLALPCLATFEHPTAEKGWFPERLERAFPATGRRYVKRAYDCCAEPEIRAALPALAVDQFAVAGAETDVCVLQSALGLLDLGYRVFLLEDCVFTSEPHPRPALERMYRAGVIPCTYKMLHYELKRTVDVPPLHVGLRGEALELVAPERLPPRLPAR